ncbi:MAG: cystathionine beta-lyase, partial [Caldibacillus sp.]
MTIFDQVFERKNTDSVKWNGMKNIYGTNDLLPMWVADTDFQAPKEVIDTLNERIHHGIFGYAMIPDRLYEAIIN